MLMRLDNSLFHSMTSTVEAADPTVNSSPMNRKSVSAKIQTTSKCSWCGVRDSSQSVKSCMTLFSAARLPRTVLEH